jgi:hypothetical protein
MPARMAMMAITTSNSMRANPLEVEACVEFFRAEWFLFHRATFKKRFSLPRNRFFLLKAKAPMKFDFTGAQSRCDELS